MWESLCLWLFFRGFFFLAATGRIQHLPMLDFYCTFNLPDKTFHFCSRQTPFRPTDITLRSALRLMLKSSCLPLVKSVCCLESTSQVLTKARLLYYHIKITSSDFPLPPYNTLQPTIATLLVV